jgi:hypothetical protein
MPSDTGRITRRASLRAQVTTTKPWPFFLISPFASSSGHRVNLGRGDADGVCEFARAGAGHLPDRLDQLTLTLAATSALAFDPSRRFRWTRAATSRMVGAEGIEGSPQTTRLLLDV